MGIKLFWIFFTITLGGFLLRSINAGSLTAELILLEKFGHLPMLDGDLKQQRIARGVYGINGTLTLSEDLGNECNVETLLYRSAMGNNQYQKLPIGAALGKLKMEDFMNKIYHKFAMEELAKCTNLPQFEDAFTPPFKAGNYYANNCLISDDAIPGFLQPGTYKLEVLIAVGEEVFGIRIVIKLLPKYD